MKKQLLLLAALLAGCGSSNDATAFSTVPSQPAPPPAVSDLQRIQAEAAKDPNTALKLAPSKHLNPLRGVVRSKGEAGAAAVQTIPVSDLESNYETLFGSLSSQFNVTLQTTEVQNDIKFIASQPGTGFFDLNKQPILNNPLGIQNVSFQPVNYSTTVPLPTGNQTFQVSGGLIMPLGISKTQVKGVIVYFHGTTFNKTQVGSNYNDEETQLNAQVFASQGYVVVIPDYVGQGVDWQTVHPYVLYPKVSAQTAVDMLTAVQPLIASQYSLTSTDPPLKLFSAGYSEGGSYSLWFNNYLSTTPGLLNPTYKLTHSVGMEGAYSTSNITYAYLFENVSASSPNPFNVQTQVLVNIVKPLLSADAFLSYATYSVGSDFGSIFNTNFFDMKATFPVQQSDCNVNGVQVNIAQAFAMQNTTISTPVLSSGLGKSANGASYPGPLTLLTDTGNTVKSLVSATLLTAGFQAQLLQVLKAADCDLTPVANQGVSILSLQQDSVVVPNNFDYLLSTFPTKIKTSIKVDQSQLLVLSPFSGAVGHAVWTPTDHLHGLIYEYLYALNIFNSF